MRETHEGRESACPRGPWKLFYLLSESAENSYCLKDSQGDKCSRWARKLSISEGLIIKSLTVIIEDQILEVTNSLGLYVAVISKKSWRVQTVFTKEWFDIKCPSAEVETNKTLVESLKSRSEEIFSVQKELGGLHCRWKAYHQDLDRIDEMKHLGPVYKERGLPLC